VAQQQKPKVYPMSISQRIGNVIMCETNQTYCTQEIRAHVSKH